MPTFMRCISSCPVSMRRIGHGLDGFLAMLAILALALALTKPAEAIRSWSWQGLTSLTSLSSIGPFSLLDAFQALEGLEGLRWPSWPCWPCNEV
jgi:hypothetical protein